MSETSSKWLLRIGEVMLIVFWATVIIGLWIGIISLQRLALQVLGIASLALGGSLILTNRMLGSYLSKGNLPPGLSTKKPIGRKAGTVGVRWFCLRTGIWLLVGGLGLLMAILPAPDGMVANSRFPDKDVCSLQCGSTWNTYTTPGIQFGAKGYIPKSGDAIVWRMTSIDGDRSSIAFTGIWLVAGQRQDMKISIYVNEKPVPLRAPNWYEERGHTLCDIGLEENRNVSVGDEIKVLIDETQDHAVIESIQPSGGH